MAFAQSTGYSVDWYTVDGGGGSSVGGLFTLSGTAGQPDASALGGGLYSAVGGFWHASSDVVASLFHLNWWTVDGGGTTNAAGGQYTLGGTAGQPDASNGHSGGIFEVTGGFWSAFRTVVSAPTNVPGVGLIGLLGMAGWLAAATTRRIWKRLRNR